MRCLCAVLLSCSLPLCAQDWIVDTDGGTDDYLAIAYLMAKPKVRIEAVTTVNGLSGSAAGARVVARLAQLAGRPDLPVYVGASRALVSKAAFPVEWRKMSEELPGVALPALTSKIRAQSAEDFYLARLKRPARILALGPLTNLALALRKAPGLAVNVQELIVMGGALRVPGNLKDGDLFQTKNSTAEWNLFMDPEAAALVFAAVRTIKLVPLDATNRVPFRLEDIRRFERGAVATPLGRFATQILKLDEPMIRAGYYYAWDPLAAVVMAEPRLGRYAVTGVRVSVSAGEEGRTVPVSSGGRMIQVLDAPRPEDFHAEFHDSLAAQRRQ